MISRSKLAPMLALVTAAMVSVPAPAGAQGDASAAVKVRVPITNTTFAKFKQASANFAAYVKQHPDDKDLDDTEFENASDAATAICGPRPALKAAIAAAGLTCTEWVSLTVELFQAASADAIIKAGQKVPPELGVSPADIAFYDAHAADIQLAFKEIKATDEQ